MDPIIMLPEWDSYTPTGYELLQNREIGTTVQIVQSALSVTIDPDIGDLVNRQGTFLDYGQSMVVVGGVEVNYRVFSGPYAVVGRNPA